MNKSHLLNSIIFVLSAVIILVFTWQDEIIFTDEILFQEAAYQILETGDYLTPQLEGRVWLEKPPLYFWFTAFVFNIFGISTFTLRLGVTLSALATVYLTYKLAKYLYGRIVALWSTIIIATAPLFLYFTKTANLDIPVTFFILLTIYAYLKAKSSNKWLLVSALSLGLGILTRSFLALTPLPVILIDQLFLSLKSINSKKLISAFLLALIISLPWNLYMYKFFPNQYLTDHLSFNLKTHFLKQTPGHPPISVIQFLFSIFVFLNPLALLALATPFIKRHLAHKELFLLVWILSTVLPLTISVTRHEWYAIQILPPLSILAGLGLANLLNSLSLKLSPLSFEVIKIYGLSFLLAIPASVFLAIPKQTKVVTMLNQFLEATSESTPLNNLEHQYIPNSTLFNPRQTPVLLPKDLQNIKQPTYLYLSDQDQLDLATQKLQNCCTYQIFLENQDAKIIKISPK